MSGASHIVKVRRRYVVDGQPETCIEERWITAGDQKGSPGGWFEMRYMEIPLVFLNLSPEAQVAIFPRVAEVDPLILKILSERYAVYLIGKMVGMRKTTDRLIYTYYAKGDSELPPSLEAVLEAYKRRFQHRNALHLAKVAWELVPKFLDFGFRKLEGSGLLVAGRPGRRRWEKVEVSFRF